MSGRIHRFPYRCIAAVLVFQADDGWLALAGSSGWLFGSRREALREARWLARNLAWPVRELRA
jgi:hypothetical protein